VRKTLQIASILILFSSQKYLLVLTGVVSPSLLTASNFANLGAFRLPNDSNAYQFDTGYGMVYRSADDTLLVSSGLSTEVGEVSTPAFVDTSSLGSMNTASIVHSSFDVFEGNKNDIASISPFDQCGNGCYVGGLAFNTGGDLIASVFPYYSSDVPLSHFKLEGDVSGYIGGPYGFEDPAITTRHNGVFAGAMALVPSNRRSYIEGPWVTGQCCISIGSRTNWGPGFASVDLDDLGASIAAAKIFSGFPSANPNLGSQYSGYCDARGTKSGGSYQYICSTATTGVAIPTVGRTLITAGIRGDIDHYCYGSNVSAGTYDTPSPFIGTDGATGSDASTITATRIQLPNKNTSAMYNSEIAGAYGIQLTGETTPAAYNVRGSRFPQTGPAGLAMITGYGNSGASNAYVDVNASFTSGLSGKSYTVGTFNCYTTDTSSGQKGNHSGPYEYVLNLWDLDEVAEVIAGSRNYYAIYPYETVPLTFSKIDTHNNRIQLGGLAINHTDNTMFIYQAYADDGGCCDAGGLINGISISDPDAPKSILFIGLITLSLLLVTGSRNAKNFR
jgi:hypothetical protein